MSTAKTLARAASPALPTTAALHAGEGAGNVLATPDNSAAAANHDEPIGGSRGASGDSLVSVSSGEPDRKN